MARPILILILLLAGTCPGAPERATETLTIVSANLSATASQAYEEPGIRILQALKPDIIAIQEFNYKHGNSQDLARRLMGPNVHFHREKGGARLPNGILSRWPIVASGQWPDPCVRNRSFAWATIAIPGPRPLHVVSVHLVHNRSERRIAEARHLLQLIRDAFPPDDYIALCGDLNLNSRQAEVLGILTAWFDDSAVPADQEGNPHTNANRNRPYDFVLPNPALARHHVPTRFRGHTFPGGLVFDTRLWNPPPPPAEGDDSARDLQHLPVMKTFAIPRP